jgi:hypothetical protein
MFTQFTSITLIASCFSTQGHLGERKAILTRNEDHFSYRLVYEKIHKGPKDADKVIVDTEEPTLSATHMEDSMLYPFQGWEIEIFKPFTSPDRQSLSAVIRKVDASGQKTLIEHLTCSFHD